MPSIRDTLAPSRHHAESWNEFDASWYRQTYAIGDDVQDLIDHSIRVGQGQGHAPNVYFDEAWYLNRYPDVATAVSAGHFKSGFDHYCRSGLERYAPHWLFDPSAYLAASQDLSSPTLQEAGFLNAYDHFLRVGSAEGRSAHPLFDSRVYAERLKECDDADSTAMAAPFARYLYRLHARKPDVPSSVYFDAAWYAAAYPQCRDPRSGFLSPLHHYLCNETPTAFDPLPDFSEDFYLGLYPDVADAVARRGYRNGYLHFLLKGVFEFRSPARHINLLYYWERHESVRRAVQDGRMRDAFVHLLSVGLAKGLMLAPLPPTPAVPEDQTRALFTAQAQSMLPFYGRHRLDFTPAGPASCSVVIPLNNGFALAMQTIASCGRISRAPSS